MMRINTWMLTLNVPRIHRTYHSNVWLGGFYFGKLAFFSTCWGTLLIPGADAEQTKIDPISPIDKIKLKITGKQSLKWTNLKNTNNYMENYSPFWHSCQGELWFLCWWIWRLTTKTNDGTSALNSKPGPGIPLPLQSQKVITSAIWERPESNIAWETILLRNAVLLHNVAPSTLSSRRSWRAPSGAHASAHASINAQQSV